ncbi:ATP-grasp fold amidoligase family protein [Adlercreutzia faecimuris]|uniref:Glycosyltransferase n=1 Tax=Adlercreutzia faecimuris TaxID=2897341 RepID=A0ABS9WJ28_9ACTN|nr:ATP-grasp fold amidoligase family protein [Adlercreutzia sp. JBNU-10]MCI2242814.1 hypothetical protein [Adlercreutzia sp. JBNU-10]
MRIKHLLRTDFPNLYSKLKRVYQKREIEKHREMSVSAIVSELGKMYRKRIGLPLDLSDPKRYTEKIQWVKLYGCSDQSTLLSDKYAVRDWVERKIGSEYLIPLLGVWESVDEINIDELPQAFVLKTNNASGTNILVRDKREMDWRKTKRVLNDWLFMDYAYYSFELQYKDIAPRIIAEELMKPAEGESDLRDYKFLCFDGEPAYIWVDVNRNTNHARAVYNLRWELQSWNQCDYPEKVDVEKPQSFDEMIELAKILSSGFPHVRVDLYEINGRPYFGEMTFTNGSGFERIDPIEYDELLGSMWTIDSAEDPYELVKREGRPQYIEGAQTTAEGHPQISRYPRQEAKVTSAKPSGYLGR